MLISNLFFSQYITGLSATQNGDNQVKTNLKVYLPAIGNYESYTVENNENTYTLSVYYYMGGGLIATYLENNFDINIPNNSNSTLKVNMYVKGSDCGSQYCLEDTATLNFTTPINGTVSLATSEYNIDNKNLTLFPNPASKILNIDTPFQAQQINIYDNSGKKVLNITNPKENKIDISSLANGTYHLEIINNKNKLTKKFIVRKE